MLTPRCRPHYTYSPGSLYLHLAAGLTILTVWAHYTYTSLQEAKATLKVAQEKHEKLEEAASEVVLLATPRPIDDYASVDLALGRARQVG